MKKANKIRLSWMKSNCFVRCGAILRIDIIERHLFNPKQKFLVGPKPVEEVSKRVGSSVASISDHGLTYFGNWYHFGAKTW